MFICGKLLNQSLCFLVLLEGLGDGMVAVEAFSCGHVVGGLSATLHHL